MDWLSGKKTYFVAVAAIAYAWLGFAFGHVDANTAVEMTLAALGGSALRSGIKK